MRYPLEVITWDDHAGPGNGNPKKVKLIRRVTAGFIVREDETTVVIAGTVDGQAAEDMTALGKGLIVDRFEAGSIRIKRLK